MENLNKERNKDEHRGEVDRDHRLKVSILNVWGGLSLMIHVRLWYMCKKSPYKSLYWNQSSLGWSWEQRRSRERPKVFVQELLLLWLLQRPPASQPRESFWNISFPTNYVLNTSIFVSFISYLVRAAGPSYLQKPQWTTKQEQLLHVTCWQHDFVPELISEELREGRKSFSDGKVHLALLDVKWVPVFCQMGT